MYIQIIERENIQKNLEEGKYLKESLKYYFCWGLYYREKMKLKVIHQSCLGVITVPCSEKIFLVFPAMVREKKGFQPVI